MTKKYFRIIALLPVLAALASTPVQAQVCAMCVVAIGGGLGLSRLLGIDDLLAGVWLGALILALGSFIGTQLHKKYHRAWIRPLSFVVAFGVGYGSLYAFHFFQDSPVRFGTSSLLVGMIVGTLTLIAGEYGDKFLRRLKNDHGRPYFPYQRVVVPVVCLVVATLCLSAFL